MEDDKDKNDINDIDIEVEGKYLNSYNRITSDLK